MGGTVSCSWINNRCWLENTYLNYVPPNPTWDLQPSGIDSKLCELDNTEKKTANIGNRNTKSKYLSQQQNDKIKGKELACALKRNTVT